MIAILFAGLAHGTEHPAPNAAHEPAAHGVAAPASSETHAGEGHAGEGHAGEEHAEAHEGGGAHHHVSYSADDDSDGIPNWRDPMNHDVPNTSSYVLTGLGWHTVNLFILLGVLGYAVRRPLADTFRSRALAIRTELTSSATAREEAHQRHQDLVARLQRIESEVRLMEQQAAVDAQQEEEKLVERANREAQRIAEQAERNLRDETNRARQALRSEAVELAVRLAEATLTQKVTAADRQALARDFLTSLKEADRV